MTEEYQAALEGDNSSYGATSSVPKVCVCVCVWRGGAAPVEMALLYILYIHTLKCQYCVSLTIKLFSKGTPASLKSSL